MRLSQIYFSAADKQMETFVDKKSFEESLVLSLLFQGNVVIPDIFFYISSHLRDLILSDNDNLLIAGLKDGVIIPSFRNNGNGTFRQNYLQIVEEGIQGLLDNANEIALSLDMKVVNVSTKYNFRVWPDSSLSEGFENIVTKVLLAESPISNSALFSKIWDKTAILRKQCIEEAIESSHKISLGLRRGSLQNSIAKFAGLNKATIHDIKTIINNVKDHSEQVNIRYFLKWINYCYQYNQGVMLGLEPCLSKMDEIDISFSESLCTFTKPVQVIKNEEVIDPVNTIIEIPTVEQLLSIPSNEILKVRNGQYGSIYFDSLDKWQHNPSIESSYKLIHCLKEYSDELKYIYVRYGNNILQFFNFIYPTVPGYNLAFKYIAESSIKFINNFCLPVHVLRFVFERISCIYHIMPLNVKSYFDDILKINKKLEYNETKNYQSLKSEEYFSETKFKAI